MNLYHLLVPHPKNNHRSKILHHISLLILISIFTLFNLFGALVVNTHPEVLGISYNISENELLDLVNYERGQEGLEPLVLNTKLTQAAREKGLHMFANNYWAHFAPDGTTPWSFIKSNSYDYIYAGENLAKGFTNSVDAVEAWMNSPTHRANIMSPKFKDIGFSISEGKLEGEDTILIVQMFGSTEIIASEAPSPNIDSRKVVSQIPATNPAKALGSEEKSINKIENNPIIDAPYVAKAIVFVLLSVLLTALFIDLIVVEKNKIPRIVGNNMDHIILIILFLAFLFTNNLGNVI